MPADTPPISEHQLCSTPSLCSTLVARLRTILKSIGPRHAATISVPRLSNLCDHSVPYGRSGGTMGAFLPGVTYPRGGRRGDDGRRYIGIPKPKRISNPIIKKEDEIRLWLQLRSTAGHRERVPSSIWHLYRSRFLFGDTLHELSCAVINDCSRSSDLTMRRRPGSKNVDGTKGG
ncbi:hypothetical protein ALC53_09620 [Atta colombica]|uniref:Uncharacterized protein n=1 Tax=Atta colombica TaxID=520822 RepID=A0A151I1G9_9HYME|nr:hypothetical protein ALC53_09620 [Atta colombica]